MIFAQFSSQVFHSQYSPSPEDDELMRVITFCVVDDANEERSAASCVDAGNDVSRF